MEPALPLVQARASLLHPPRSVILMHLRPGVPSLQMPVCSIGDFQSVSLSCQVFLETPHLETLLFRGSPSPRTHYWPPDAQKVVYFFF